MPEERKDYRLASAPLIHTPGFLGMLRQQWQYGGNEDRMFGICSFAAGFPGLPMGLCVTWLAAPQRWIDENVRLEDNGETLVITWAEPDYNPEWFPQYREPKEEEYDEVDEDYEDTLRGYTRQEAYDHENPAPLEDPMQRER